MEITQLDSLRVCIGMQVLIQCGYEKVYANDGVIAFGSSVDTDLQEDLLTASGWEWDEDNSQWYILVRRDESNVQAEIKRLEEELSQMSDQYVKANERAENQAKRITKLEASRTATITVSNT